MGGEVGGMQSAGAVGVQNVKRVEMTFGQIQWKTVIY